MNCKIEGFTPDCTLNQVFANPQSPFYGGTYIKTDSDNITYFVWDWDDPDLVCEVLDYIWEQGLFQDSSVTQLIAHWNKNKPAGYPRY